MREVINLNEGWKFIQQDAGLPETLPADWKQVDLPHTWNAMVRMETEVMTEEVTGMRECLRHRCSRLGEGALMWRS